MNIIVRNCLAVHCILGGWQCPQCLTLSCEHSAQLSFVNIILHNCLAAGSVLWVGGNCLAVYCGWQSVCCLPAWAPSMCWTHFILPHSMLPHFIQPHFALPHFILPHFIRPHSMLPHFALPHFILPSMCWTHTLYYTMPHFLLPHYIMPHSIMPQYMALYQLHFTI